jgi:hypothetical protein
MHATSRNALITGAILIASGRVPKTTSTTHFEEFMRIYQSPVSYCSSSHFYMRKPLGGIEKHRQIFTIAAAALPLVGTTKIS